MSPEAFAHHMRELYAGNYDPEGAHGEADELMASVLRDMGYADGVAIFEAAERWYA